LLPFREKRRYRRFALRYPVHILLRSADHISEGDAVSKDVSLGGLLLETSMPMAENTTLNFVISLQDPELPSVDLLGEGKVVRVEPYGNEGKFAVAVECANPITQIQPYFPAG